MVCTYRHFAPGARQAAQAYASHLLEKTIETDRMAQAVYYTQGQEVPAAASAEAMGSIPLVRADLDPRLAAALGIEANAVLSAEQLANVLGGRRADGDDIERGSNQQGEVRTYEDAEGNVIRHRIAGTDFTFSAPKSLSVAWALAGTDAERWSLLQAHRDAVTETLGYMEDQIAKAGFGQGHRQGGEERGRLAWFTIEHFTARPTLAVTRPDPETGVVATEIYTVQAGDKIRGDMQIHTHAIVPNLMATESGRLVAMNRDELEGRLHEFGAVYHAILAKNLRAIGVEAGLCPRTLTSMLPAIPEEVCQAFSKRSVNGTEAARSFAKEQGLDWDTLDADRKIALVKSGTQSHKLPKDFTLTPEQRKDYENSARKDDLADFVGWAATAERIGFKHQTVVTHLQPAEPAEEAVRIAAGAQATLPIFEPELDKRAVVRVSDLRIAIARALIASGAKEAADVGRVLLRVVADGVRQQKGMTQLLAPAGFDNARARITTAMHRDQEQEVIRLARGMAEDKRFALTPDTLRRHTTEHNFEDEIGKQQKRAIGKVGVGGAVGIFIGVGGAGKTTKVIPPLVQGWQEDGREVWGTALARRQADALAEAGIATGRCVAMEPLLSGLREGAEQPLPMKPGSVVVVDEFSQIGTRQLLELLQAAVRHDFKVVLTGDERQCQSIEAGPIIELLAEALGPNAIPEITKIMRQASEREREIATLFRGERGDRPEDRLRAVTKAVEMKRQDGTAELVPGGREEVVKRAAEAFMDATTRNHNNPDYKVSISAPTNADAMEISLAIRGLRQKAGQVAADAVVVPAINSNGDRYDLALAPGDRVRLYKRTQGRFPGEDGREHSAAVGNNGTVLRVLGIVDETVRYGKKVVHREGLRVQTPSGKVAFVEWEKLRAKGTNRVQMAYGDCLTIDSSQGITSDEHINALPGGSRSVQGFKNYVASSRHKIRSLLISSAGAELEQVDQARPAGAPVPTEWPLREREAWDNLIANIAQQPVKETAMQLLRGAIEDTRQSVRALQKHLRAAEARERAGLAATTVRENLDQTAAAEQLSLALAPLAGEVRATLDAVRAAVPPAEDIPPPVDVRDEAPPPGWDDYRPGVGAEVSPPAPVDAPPPGEAPAGPPAVSFGDVDRWVQAEAGGHAALVAVGHTKFADAAVQIEDAVRAWVDAKAEVVWSPDRVEWLMDRARTHLAAAVEAFEVRIEATAAQQAGERMAVRAGRYGPMVAGGLWNEDRAVAALVKDEARVQADPSKVAWPLSNEKLAEVARPIAQRLLAAHAPRAQETPTATAAAGGVRAVPKQGPRMGA